MKQWKIFTLLVFLTFGMLPGCGDDFDSCISGNTERFFDITGFTSYHARGEIFNYKPLSNNSIVAFDDYRGLHIYPQLRYYNVESIPEETFPSFTSKMMACTPVLQGYEGSENEALFALTVTTLTDFNDAHRSGDKLDDIINVLDGDRYITLSSFLQDRQDKLLTNENFPIVIQPDKQSTLSSTLQLEIYLELSNGESYTFLTDEVTLE